MVGRRCSSIVVTIQREAPSAVPGKDLVENNFPKPLFSIVEPFVLSLSKHDRLDAVGRNFPAHPSTSSGRTEKFHSIHIGKLLLTIS